MAGAQGVNFAIPVNSLRQLLREPEIHIQLADLDWQKRFEPQSFNIIVAPFTLFDGGTRTRGAYDLEVAVGYEETWRKLTVKRDMLDGGTTQFSINGVFYQGDLPPDTDLMYRITLRQNGLVVASREYIVPTTGAPTSGALAFDGKSDNAAILLKNWPGRGNPPHSVEMWVRPDSLPPRRAWLMLLGSYARQHHWLYLPSGELYLGVGGDASGQVNTTLPVGKWTHMAATFGDGVLTVYVNGEQVAETYAKFDFQGSPNAPFSLAKSYMGEAFFKGAIREVRIWDRELSQNNIRTNMNLALSGNEPGLVLYWPLNEGEGNIIHDRSNHGNDAKLTADDRWVPLGQIGLDMAK